MWAYLKVLNLVSNVCSAEKLTKCSTVFLLRLVSFSAEQTLVYQIEVQDQINVQALMVYIGQFVSGVDEKIFFFTSENDFAV